jgi:hypothetical protein
MSPAGDDTATSRSVKELLTCGLITACFYTHRRQDRPCCECLGLIRYGPTTLCADCDRRRSAVGKGMAPVRLPDPVALLEVLAAQDAYRQGELALRHAVRSARAAGHAWSAVGLVLGITRQAAQQRFNDPAVTDSSKPPTSSAQHHPIECVNKEVINQHH